VSRNWSKLGNADESIQSWGRPHTTTLALPDDDDDDDGVV